MSQELIQGAVDRAAQDTLYTAADASPVGVVGEAAAIAGEAHAPTDDVEGLFGRMHPQRRIMKKIIRFCAEPRTDTQLIQAVEGFTRHDSMVYEPAVLCHLMTKYGALSYQPPFDEAYEQTDEALMRNAGQFTDGAGEVCLVTTCALGEGQERGEGVWQATDQALAFIGAFDGLAAFDEAMAQDAALVDAYACLLEFCVRRGRTKMDIDEVIDPHPALQNPRMHAGHLISVLERCECLEWQGAWRTTDLGKQALEHLRA